ncbi:MAG: YraN family protein [Gammaproteobacteria bacterium]|nr:MAG: YraN family protein [Gammaproteobacteria bacterium]
MDRRALGRRMEEEALRHLLARGLSLLARNWRCRAGEVDLVLQEGEAVVFVEVRYRSGSAFGGGAASVDPLKRRRLRAAALHYLQRRAPGAPARFDVVELRGDPARPQIRWIRDAFRED